MDLAAKKKAREERMQAKRDMIKSQATDVAPNEVEAVSKDTPREDTRKDTKNDNKDKSTEYKKEEKSEKSEKAKQ